MVKPPAFSKKKPMTKIDNKIRSIFAANKALRVLYAFPDGNIFSDKGFALNHQRACKADLMVVNREDLVERTPKKLAKAVSETKGKKGNAITLQDQLMALDLENPDGPMYNVYKQLRDGLGIKTADNKMVTIVAALADEQKKLKTKKPE